MLNVVMVKANAGDDDGAVVRSIAISVPTEQVRRRRCRRQRRHSIALVINKVRSMAFSSVHPRRDSARRHGIAGMWWVASKEEEWNSSGVGRLVFSSGASRVSRVSLHSSEILLAACLLLSCFLAQVLLVFREDAAAFAATT